MKTKETVQKDRQKVSKKDEQESLQKVSNKRVRRLNRAFLKAL